MIEDHNANASQTQYIALQPSLVAARRFIAGLTGSPSTTLDYRLIHDSDKAKPAKKLVGTIDGLWPEIEAGQIEGYGAFFVVNNGGPADEDIAAVRALFIDADGRPELDTWEWHKPPHLFVRRDAAHWHAYWRVTGLDVSGFKAAQLRLAARYGSDTKVCNPSRVMRLPGTLHLKDPSRPYLVTFESRDGVEGVSELYEAAEILTGLPEVAAKQSLARTAPEEFVYDQSWNVSRAIEWLKRRAPAIEGQNGDDWTLTTCHTLRDLGVSPEKALELLEPWNARCEPPWGMEELEDKLGRARQNEDGCEAITEPGSVTFAAAVAALCLIDMASTGPQSFHDLRHRVVAPVKELVVGLLEQGTVTFLSAPGGSHKSRLALQWGLCIDNGEAIFGRAVTPATFFYLSYEDHEDEVARRVQAIASRLNLPDVGSGVFWDLSGGDFPIAIVRESGEVELQPFHADLTSRLKAYLGHKFIVVDGTYNALRFAGAAKINETSVMAGIACLQQLCADTNSTILALWHPSQAGQERGDASGWSVAWHNAPRARLSLNAVKDRESMFELKVEKRNHGPKGLPTTLYFDRGALLPVSQAGGADREARLVDACARIAVMAAGQGSPIQKQRRLNKWMLDEIERDCGYRPPEKEVKEALATGLHRQQLRYVNGSKDRVAGYYPFDLEAAAEMAREAKHRRPEP